MTGKVKHYINIDLRYKYQLKVQIFFLTSCANKTYMMNVGVDFFA